MATKTFEELKQLAIQIRDEKTNKQNTATRIGTQMLEHLDKLEQDYYDKTATDEELKERDEKLTELENITSSLQNDTDNNTSEISETKAKVEENSSSIASLKLEKQDTLNFDAIPTLGSNNPVTSGGIRTALDEQKSEVDAAKEEAIQTINETEQSVITNFNTQRVTPEMLSEATKQLINTAGGGTINNLPDDEDLTSQDDGTGSNVLKLADRSYNPTNFSGKGYKILRKNIVDGKNILTQDMINQANTVYEIRYDYDLNDVEITIPQNCILQFNGGSFDNGALVCNNTFIKGNNCLKLINIKGDIYNNIIYSDWFCMVKISVNEFMNDSYSDISDYNNTVMQNCIDNQFSIFFGSGIYIFSKPLYYTWTNKMYGIYAEETSKMAKDTVLYFPNSEGLYFGNENWFSIYGLSIKNVFIDSKEHCVYFKKTQNEAANITRAFFENVAFHSLNGDCINDEGGVNSYDNHFRDCLFSTNNEHGFINRFGTLIITIDTCIDGVASVYGQQKYKGDLNHPLYVVKNSNNVKLTNCNLTNTGLKYIVWCDGSVSNIYSGSFYALNCNFEGINGPIVYSPTNLVGFNIVFINSSVLISDTYKDEFDSLFYVRLINAVFSNYVDRTGLEYYVHIYGGIEPNLLWMAPTGKIGNENFNYLMSSPFSNEEIVRVLYSGSWLGCSKQPFIACNLLYPSAIARTMNTNGTVKSYIFNDALGGIIPNYGTTDERPTTPIEGLNYFDTTIKKQLVRIQGKWYYVKVLNVDYVESGNMWGWQSAGKYPMFTNFYLNDLQKVLFSVGDKWVDAFGNRAGTKYYGKFSEKPSSDYATIGFAYFCTDKQTVEGSTNGIIIYHKGNNVWVDALGRVIE